MNLQVAQRILQVALSLCLDLLSGVTVLAINALYNFEHLQFLGNKNQNLGKNCSTLLLSCHNPLATGHLLLHAPLPAKDSPVQYTIQMYKSLVLAQTFSRFAQTFRKLLPVLHLGALYQSGDPAP